MRKLDPIGSIVWRYVTPEREHWKERGRKFVKNYDPRLPVPYLPIKAEELLRTLHAYRPGSIVEFGSGHSTAWFASYAAKTGAKVTSFEQSPEWVQKSRGFVGEIGPSDVRLAEVREFDVGGRRFARYDAEIPSAEMIYVDGPAAAKATAGYDAIALLKVSSPRLIVVDGRHATVLALLEALNIDRKAPSSDSAWRFEPSVDFAFRQPDGAGRQWRQIFKRRAHSFFFRNEDSIAALKLAG